MIKKDTNGNNGGLSLTTGMSPDKSIFDVEYLSVEGLTEVIGGASTITTTFTNNRPEGKCDIVFMGGYYQKNATVKIEKAKNIIMQGNIDIGIGNAPTRLDLKADQIYFDSEDITHGDEGNSVVSYSGINPIEGTDFYIKSTIKWKDKNTYNIHGGLYESVKGQSLKDLKDIKRSDYKSPGIIKPPHPGTSVNTETGEVVVINNSSIYY